MRACTTSLTDEILVFAQEHKHKRQACFRRKSRSRPCHTADEERGGNILLAHGGTQTRRGEGQRERELPTRAPASSVASSSGRRSQAFTPRYSVRNLRAQKARQLILPGVEACGSRAGVLFYRKTRDQAIANALLGFFAWTRVELYPSPLRLSRSSGRGAAFSRGRRRKADWRDCLALQPQSRYSFGFSCSCSGSGSFYTRAVPYDRFEVFQIHISTDRRKLTSFSHTRPSHALSA